MGNILTPGEIQQALQIVREREAQNGPVVIRPRIVCACKRRREIHRMPRVASTGVVDNVMSIVCPGCVKEFKGLARLVCIGCREEVGLIKPHKDKTGFCFRPDRYYHVANCPKCSKTKVVKSHILEKILFYEMNGIAYE